MSLLLENPRGKTKKNIGYELRVTSSAGAGRALKIGSPVFDFFFTLYFISLPIFYIKLRVQMGSKWAGGEGGTTFCTRPRSINQFGLYIHKLNAKTLD